MKRPLLFTLMFMLLGLPLAAQQKYWVRFADKGPEAATIRTAPTAFLSQRALDRRARLGLSIQELDLPVSKTYLAQLRTAGIRVVGASRWLNAVSVETELTLAELQAACPAVTEKWPVARMKRNNLSSDFSISQASPAPVEMTGVPAPGKTGTTTISYGATQEQLDLIGLPCLHAQGYTGAGILLAQFDSGFLDVDSITAFDSLWLQGRVIAYHDFVNQDTTIFDEDWHGLAVLSTIAANLPGVYVGGAPHVTVALARTETVFSETHQEEDNWVLAAEWADSMGADIIQSSLGYYTFDVGQTSYTYADMDGNTTIITKAADYAASRGIVVVNSAGNEGSSPWHYIIAPCDGDSVLCVGSVDLLQNVSMFSSIGPASDGRVKPDVMAMGSGSAVVGFGGNVGNFSGTSFSAPQMSAFVACLLQAHPNRTNMDVIHAIRKSADRYMTPDTAYGYGIPDACKADSILSVMDSVGLSVGAVRDLAKQIKVFPNPTSGYMTVELPEKAARIRTLHVTDVSGKRLKTFTVGLGRTQEIDVRSLPAGVYVLEVELPGGIVSAHKFIRQ